MKWIFVNLKRFDVPASMGGICPSEHPVAWMERTMRDSLAAGLHEIDGVGLVYFVPESLLATALAVLHGLPGNLSVGCQGVFREDVVPQGNFGAFTTNRPASAMAALGCRWTMIGHSEERKDKLALLNMYDPAVASSVQASHKAAAVVDGVLNGEVAQAARRSMSILFCVGETLEQKGSTDPTVYEPRVKQVIEDQLTRGLSGLSAFPSDLHVAIGYEPVWAIGPGKTPPGPDYIAFVSEWIDRVCRERFGRSLPIVYGGGLKEENAAAIASVATVSGGLVALTKFTAPIGFDVGGLKRIIQAYLKQAQ
jgi:triosephosphate isomerase